MPDNNWTLISGSTPQDYTDTAVFEVNPDTKQIALITGQALVAGEKDSQYISFLMPRYWDGIDISDKSFNIEYALAGTYYGTSEAVNAEMTTEQVRFGWIVPETACAISGTLLFVLKITSENYVLKTQIAEHPVFKTIRVEDVVPEPTKEAWYIEFQTRVDGAIERAESAIETVQSTLTDVEAAAQLAQTAATEAQGAQGAVDSASQAAQTSAQVAQVSQEAAAQSAQTASKKATEAQGYAQTAEAARDDALTAQAAAETAQQFAETAQTGAESAQTTSENARDDAQQALAQAQQAVTSAEAAAASAQIRYGSPLTAATAEEMTDENRVYVYVGSKSGYTNGNWYYYDGTAWVSGGVYNGTGINTDTTLTQSGMAADAKETGDQITELKSETYELVPRMLEMSKYTGTVSGTSFLISDKVISSGSLIKAVQAYAFSDSTSFNFYLISNATNRIIFKKTISIVTGMNYIPIMFTPSEDCLFGVYGHTFKSYAVYASSHLLAEANRFSNGYLEGDVKPAQMGDSITINHYSTNIDVAFPISLVIKESGDFQAEKALYNAAESRHITAPTLIGPPTLYTEAVSWTSFLISDKTIPTNSFIKSVRIYMSSASPNVYVFVIDNSSKVVKQRNHATALTKGWLTIPINYLNNVGEVVIGIYGHTMKAKSYVSDAYAFSNGYIEGDIKPAQIGDTITLNQYDSSTKKAFPIQWDYETTDASYINSISADMYFKTTEHLSDHGCIASFIDDDSGQYVPDIWGEIINETSIRMGFACIAGYMGGAVTPSKAEYAQMSLAQLHALYADGHEVYSHSWSHPAFYESSRDTINAQCFQSKDWLLSNGFFRGSDIIVYPGGLGFEKILMQDIVKRFYKYGIEATGGGINCDNQMMYKPYGISRINADTATLAELKAEVDKAYSENKLIVFMNHAYELNKDRTAQVQKMIDLIQYIQGKQIPIMPIGEALNQLFYW